MNRLSVLLVFALIAATVGCEKKPATLVDSYDTDDMEAAISRAQDEIDAFVAELESGDGSTFAVKAPIEDGDNVEHFWLTQLTYSNGMFSGTINNEPGSVTNVTMGDQYSIAKEDVSDWMFMRNGKMHGNYTLRPLLDSMPKAKADELRAMFAEP